LASALADLEQSRENLRDTDVRAPFAGIIAEKSVTLGERVDPGTVLFRLADVSTVKLGVRISGVDVHQLDAGIETKVFVPGLDREFTGRVTNIGPRADAATRSFPVEIFIPNAPSERLLPGMFARALLPVADYPDAILIPRETVVPDNGGPTVFVVNPETGIAMRRRVTIERRFGSRYMITGGLEPGELLVSAGQRLLVDGARVRIVARRELTVTAEPQPTPRAEGRAPSTDS
jgi:membrane fusion protein (multidrug efflux system)